MSSEHFYSILAPSLRRLPTILPPLGVAAFACLASARAEAQAGPLVRYVAFGDSITQAVGFDDCECECPMGVCPACQNDCGYPSRLENRLRNTGLNARVENQGKGGERTTQGITRIGTVLDNENGHVLLLMEGTNDISNDIGPETTLQNLDFMADEAEIRGMQAILATLIHRYPEADVDPENILNRALVRQIRDLAADTGRDLVDTFYVFDQQNDLFDDFYRPEFFTGNADPVGHPNPNGFSLLADTFRDVILGTDNVPPVVTEVEPADGSVDVSPRALIRVRVVDFDGSLDQAGSQLFINGAPVATSVIGSNSSADLTHLPVDPLPPEVAVDVRARDVAGNVLFQRVSTFTTSTGPFGPCEPDEKTLCIDHQPGDRRFRITMTWFTALNGGQGGDADATSLESLGITDGGLFSFFPGNPEVLIKVLDGCGLSDAFWVFGSAATELGFVLTIQDTLAQILGAPLEQYTYTISNLDGSPAQPRFDVRAIETCDFSQ